MAKKKSELSTNIKCIDYSRIAQIAHESQEVSAKKIYLYLTSIFKLTFEQTDFGISISSLIHSDHLMKLFSKHCNH